MYCIKCGVELADNAEKCPLCETRVVHPDFLGLGREELFPSGRLPKREKRYKIWQVFLTAAFLLPLLIVGLCDLRYNHAVTWSGYVIGALIVGYVLFVLPLWFQRPNPVIFVPCGFAAAGIYVLYICLATGGDWFLTFALPVSVGTAIITCIFVTLLKYLRKGKLFVIGGSAMGLGALALMTELLMDYTFHLSFMGWSLYPMILFFVIGGMLIYLAINKTAREKLERKLFF